MLPVRWEDKNSQDYGWNIYMSPLRMANIVAEYQGFASHDKSELGKSLIAFAIQPWKSGSITSLTFSPKGAHSSPLQRRDIDSNS